MFFTFTWLFLRLIFILLFIHLFSFCSFWIFFFHLSIRSRTCYLIHILQIIHQFILIKLDLIQRNMRRLRSRNSCFKWSLFDLFHLLNVSSHTPIFRADVWGIISHLFDSLLVLLQVKWQKSDSICVLSKYNSWLHQQSKQCCVLSTNNVLGRSWWKFYVGIWFVLVPWDSYRRLFHVVEMHVEVVQLTSLSMLIIINIWPNVYQSTLPLCNSLLGALLIILPLSFVALENAVKLVWAAKDIHFVLTYQMPWINLDGYITTFNNGSEKT